MAHYATYGDNGGLTGIFLRKPFRQQGHSSLYQGQLLCCHSRCIVTGVTAKNMFKFHECDAAVVGTDRHRQGSVGMQTSSVTISSRLWLEKTI